MIRAKEKRVLITTVTIILFALFLISIIISDVMNNRMREGINWIYYSFSILVALISTIHILLMVHSFNFSDSKACSVLCYMTIILYCIADVGVRNLYSIFPYFDALGIFINVRNYFSTMTMVFMFLDQYNMIFHGKDRYKPSVLISLILALCLILVLPSGADINIHFFFMLLALLLASAVHSISYILSLVNIQFSLRIWNLLCNLMSLVGIFMFIISINTFVSAVGALLMFLSFISFCLDTLKHNQE